jgi:hypothetical protein
MHVKPAPLQDGQRLDDRAVARAAEHDERGEAPLDDNRSPARTLILAKIHRGAATT